MNKPDYVISDGNSNSSPNICTLSSESSEQQIITNDMFSKLTIESKFVLYAIFNTPGELSQLLFNGKPKAKNVRKYLKCLGWDLGAISKTLTELKQFTKELFS